MLKNDQLTAEIIHLFQPKSMIIYIILISYLIYYLCQIFYLIMIN